MSTVFAHLFQWCKCPSVDPPVDLDNRSASYSSVYIQLAPEEYECLLDRIPPDSSAHQCLARAVKFIGASPKPDWYVVNCDLDAAEVLLSTARKDCLSVVKLLEHSIREIKHRTPRP